MCNICSKSRDEVWGPQESWLRGTPCAVQMEMPETESKCHLGTPYFNSMPTVGEAIASVLSLFECRDVYGMGGDYAAALVRALYPHLTLHSSSNETNAAFSACGMAEAGSGGVCLVTYTVGSLLCLSAAALAMAERLPVIFLSGAPAESELQTAGLHHTLLRADSWKPAWDNALQAFSALGMRAERLAGVRNEWQPNIAGEQFFKLVEHAYLHRVPVFVEVPRDIVQQRTQTLRLPVDRRELLVRSSHFDGATLIVDHITQKLHTFKKPLVYYGEKVRHNHELLAAIARFCHAFTIPFAGNIYSFSLPMRRSKLGRSYLANPWYGSMGTALPYARAVCHLLERDGFDDAPVVLIGDGGFHFQSNDLVHFQREQLGVVIVLFRNGIFHLGKSSASPLYEVCSNDFNTCELVAAYGGTGTICHTAGEFRAHLRRALDTPGKVGLRLLEVRVSADEARQSDEVRTINTYIRAKAGIVSAIDEWNTILQTR